jgi:hypothetical protein
MVGAYPQDKTVGLNEQFLSPKKHQQTDPTAQEAEIDCMQWESNSEFHKSRAEVGVIKTGGSDEGSKHTPTNETRSYDEQHTENAENVRDEQAVHCKINKFESRIS